MIFFLFRFLKDAALVVAVILAGILCGLWALIVDWKAFDKGHYFGESD